MIRNQAPSDLPRKQTEGHPPTDRPVYVTALADAWYAKRQAEGLDNPKVIPELPYRASDTGTRCDRALYYKLTDTVKSNPPTIADIWRFGLGHFVHDGVQEHIVDIAPNMRAEIEVDLRSIGIQGSGHCDGAAMVCLACSKREEVPVGPDGYPQYPMMLPENTEQRPHRDPERAAKGETETWTDYVCERCDAATPLLAPGQWDAEVERADTVLELKSVGATGFKTQATTWNGPPKGPNFGHILQGALAGAVLQAERVCVGYLSLENVGAVHTRHFTHEAQRFAAEWWYDMADLRPFVDREAKRIERLLRVKDANAKEGATQILPSRELHDPEYPVGAVITIPNPARGKAVWEVRNGEIVTQMGDYWGCVGYCDFRDKCAADGPCVHGVSPTSACEVCYPPS